MTNSARVRRFKGNSVARNGTGNCLRRVKVREAKMSRFPSWVTVDRTTQILLHFNRYVGCLLRIIWCTVAIMSRRNVRQIHLLVLEPLLLFLFRPETENCSKRGSGSHDREGNPYCSSDCF